jgi:RNA polymerase sigma factor (sigma-70 family)
VSERPDSEIVEACRRGDNRAWEELVARFGKKMYSVAYHFTLRREDAEELTQEIFLKAFENLDRYEGRYPLGAWMLTLARNLCIDQYRRRKREKSFRHISDEALLPLLPSASDPGGEVETRERTRLLLSAIGNLPEELAEILILRDLDGISYEEIGQALDLAEGTVKSRLFRARAQVARVIQERQNRSGPRAPIVALAVAAVVAS